MQYTDKYRSPLGEITLASDGDHLTGLWFDGQKYFAATLSAEHQERELPIFEQAKEWLDSYFMGKIPSFTPPIHLEDTPFRLAVWDLLSKIPYGEVVTYKELAGEIARQKGIPSMSTQASGGAARGEDARDPEADGPRAVQGAAGEGRGEAREGAHVAEAQEHIQGGRGAGG